MNFSVFLYILSVAAHMWLLVEIDPSRTTCTGLLYETIAALSVNVSILTLGVLRGFCGFRCLGSSATLVLTTLSAGVVVLSSRVALFAYEAHTICAADAESVADDDLLRDASRRDFAGMLAWAALVLFAGAVLLQHCGSLCGEGCDDDEVCDPRDPCNVEPRDNYPCKKVPRKQTFGVLYSRVSEQNTARQVREFGHPGIRA